MNIIKETFQKLGGMIMSAIKKIVRRWEMTRSDSVPKEKTRLIFIEQKKEEMSTVEKFDPNDIKGYDDGLETNIFIKEVQRIKEKDYTKLGANKYVLGNANKDNLSIIRKYIERKISEEVFAAGNTKEVRKRISNVAEKALQDFDSKNFESPFIEFFIKDINLLELSNLK